MNANGKDNQPDLKLFYPSNPGMKKLALIITILWILSFVLFINNELEKLILISLNGVRDNESIIGLWKLFSGIAYDLLWILLISYIISYFFDSMKHIRIPLFASLIMYTFGTLIVDFLRSMLQGKGLGCNFQK